MKKLLTSFFIIFLGASVYGQELKPFKSSNGNFGYKDLSGKEIVSGRYTYAQAFSEGLAQVGLNDKYGFIDNSGKEIIPLKYDNAGEFNQGLARVKLNYKYGFINKNGEEVVALVYQDAKWFSEGLAAVKLNGKWGFIDIKGKVVIEFMYDDIGGLQCFDNGKVKVKQDGRYYSIDKTGKEINSSEYNSKSESTVTLSDVDKQLVSIYQEIQQLVKIEGDKFGKEWKSVANKFKNRLTTEQDESFLRVAYEKYNNLINISKNKADKIPANENNMTLKSTLSKFCEAEQNVASTMYVMLRETDRKYFEDNLTSLENQFKKRDNYGAQLVTQYKIFIGEIPKSAPKPTVEKEKP